MQLRSAPLLAATLLGGALLASPAQAQYVQAGPGFGKGGQVNRPSTIQQGRGVQGAPRGVVRQGRGYDGGRGYGRRGVSGGAVAAGVLGGLAAGAIVGGAIAGSQPAAAPRPPGLVDPDVADWCAERYRTYDYRSGTYLSPSGERLVCVP